MTPVELCARGVVALAVLVAVLFVAGCAVIGVLDYLNELSATLELLG